MLELHELNTSHLWSLACRFARCMFDIAGRNPLASDRHVSQNMRSAALRLTAKVFEAYESSTESLKLIHLVAATDSACELRHFLSIADRTTAIAPNILDQAHALSDELSACLNRYLNRDLAETA